MTGTVRLQVHLKSSVLAACSSARIEQHRDGRGSAECEALDHGCGLVGVEPQVREPVEDRVQANLELQPREMHAEALVLSGAERKVVLHRSVDVELVGVLV